MRIVFAIIFCLLAAIPGANAQPKGHEGTWLGKITFPGGTLRLVFHIKKLANGTYSATADSPDQFAKGIPVASTVVTGKTIKLNIEATKATYEGMLSEDGKEIKGNFTQGATIPVTLVRTEKVEDPPKPQDPVKPYPYGERDVAYPNPAAKGVTLAGTLTFPRSKGPHPAVLLITGSGAQDRNESLLGHRPFLVLADNLTRRGFAVLRVDDRGTAKSTGDFGKATSLDFASDVKAGLDFLKKQPEVDAKRIGLMGHSEGGLIAPIVASERPDVKFIVLLAGPGVTGEQIMRRQSGDMAKAMGANAETVASNAKLQKAIFDIVKSEANKDKCAARIEAAWKSFVAGLPEPVRTNPAVSPAAMKAQIDLVNTPWFRFFLSYDPAVTLRKVKCPVLAVNGTLDLQVAADVNIPAIDAALKAGGNPHYETHKLPQLNHLFQHAKTGSMQEYATSQETFAPQAMDVIIAWLRKEAGLK